MSRRRRVVIDQCTAISFSAIGVAAARGKLLRCDAPAHQADDSCGEHDGWKWHMKEVDRNERGSTDTPECRIPEGARSDAPCRKEHNGSYGRFNSIQQARHQRRAF